ncbi:MAG: porin family protein [Bacteroidales bacterium]|nr:porin family protein [Bacteroidales bacterium]
MKKTTFILFLLAILSLGSLNAQTGLRFGLKAGYSMALQYGIPPADDTYTVDTDSRNGFAGGVLLYIPITESVGLQQELLYAQKGSRQDVTINLPVSINTVSVYDLNYFEMPMIVKYRFFKIQDFAVYGSTGIALSLLLNGEYDITTTINMGGPPIVVPESGDMKGLDTFDYSFVYGLGTDFKLLKQDFFFDVRMTVGWNTLEMPNATGADPVPLRNQDYVFALGMYF